MSDIIDIEEHDVMENPTIRQLFPDLSIIKKEISQYDSDAGVLCQNDKYKTVIAVQCERNQEIIDINQLEAMDSHNSSRQIFPDLSVIKEESVCRKIDTAMSLPTDDPDKTCCAVESKSQQVKMTDEIDIEEHDVLNNPTLKRLFPDLSVIKEEISNYEGELNVKLDKIREESEVLTPQLDVHLLSKCDSSNFTTFNPGDLSGPENSEGYLHTNIIILGSKPNKSANLQEKQDHKTKMNVPKVTLENVFLYLNKCKMYCKGCLTLFPSECALKDHIKTVHGHRIKHSLNKMKNDVNKYQCNNCGGFLSTKANLIRHLKHIHNDVQKNGYRSIKTNKKAVSKIAAGNGKKSNVTDPSCFHCHISFSSQKSLIDHLYDVLQPKKTECKKPNKLNYNAENAKSHETVDHHEQNSAYNLFECCKCATKFLTKEQLDLHNEETHNNFHVKPIKIVKAREKSEVTYKVRTVDSCEYLDEPEVLPKRMRKAITRNEESTGSCATETVENEKHNSVLEKLKRNKEFRSENILKDCKAHTKHVTLNNHSNTNKTNSDKEILVEKAYQCSICCHYGLNYNIFNKHMINNHKMYEVPKPRKVLFDSQCKFCSSKLVNIPSYNNHIYKYHEDKVLLNSRSKVNSDTGKIELKKPVSNKQTEQKSFAFKSVLYKCNKCDIHFVTAKNAVNHLDHMEVLINWKCFICSRIFKKIDKFLHVKQHSYSHSFTVYDISETALNKVLYKCPSCTIHFNEDSYLNHNSVCGKQTPDSVYCKVCDYLINAVDYKCHNSIHAENKYISPLDFTIVEADSIIDIQTTSTSVASKLGTTSTNDQSIDLKKIFHDKSRFYLTFCQACQSFVTNLGSTRKVHNEARCMHIKKYTCKECGLILTSSTLKSHKKLHREVKGLNIQSFFFYDTNSKKLVCPPVPTYPHCDVCAVYFLSKTDVKEHECNGYDYVVCHICQIKLSKAAYKFHSEFHGYSMTNSDNQSDTADLALEKNGVDLNHTTISSSPKKRLFVEMKFMFTCKSCKITFDTYDRVIKHCQSHYDHNKILEATQSCQYCTLCFEIEYYITHERMHLRNNFDIQSVRIINFDPLYFRYYNNFWMKHIFVSLSDDQMEQIIGDSIYRYEGRLKMEVLQSGPSHFTLYKCEKCLVFVEPKSLYAHTENLQCTKMLKFPCSLCDLCFDSSNFKIDHEKLHEYPNITLQSYRVVITNKKQDQIFHSMLFKSRDQFILYQCRNCNLTVDKTQRRAHNCDISDAVKCTYCDLFFHKEYYDTHINRHQDLDKFNIKHIHLVLFGKNIDKVHQKVDTFFNGKVYDYTFYKCKTCELCIRAKDSTFKHKCVFDSSKRKCGKCDLYFLRQELTSHVILHETDPELEDYNLNIVQFDPTPNVEESKHTKINSLVQNIDVECPNKLVKIFRCDCELHFIDEDNAKKHYNNCNPKMKISKQRCSKCELLFTPGELFSHLLTHHGDKKIEYKFDITAIPVSDKDKKSTVYKCIKCNLHFVKESEVNDHIDDCEETSSAGEKCKKCGLTFKLYSYHRNKHRKTCERKYEVNVVSHIHDKNQLPINESVDNNSGYVDDFVSEMDMLLAAEYSISKENLQKIDLSKYNNVLYKCEICNIHFLTAHTRRRHSMHFATPLDVCTVCGLSFSLQSLTKHNYIHHERLKLQKNDFIIKTHA